MERMDVGTVYNLPYQLMRLRLCNIQVTSSGYDHLCECLEKNLTTLHELELRRWVPTVDTFDHMDLRPLCRIRHAHFHNVLYDDCVIANFLSNNRHTLNTLCVRNMSYNLDFHFRSELHSVPNITTLAISYYEFVRLLASFCEKLECIPLFGSLRDHEPLKQIQSVSHA